MTLPVDVYLRPGHFLRLPAPPGALVVNQHARGLGDAVLGLCATAALKAQDPKRTLVYRVAVQAMPFVAAFTGYDVLAAQRPGTAAGDPPPDAPPGELQLNRGWREEDRDRCKVPRVLRYCRNAGAAAPVLPALRDRRTLAAAGARHAGCVVLAPFSAHGIREYHVNGWVTLQRRLGRLGHRTLIVCAPAEAGRAAAVPGDRLTGGHAAAVLAALRSASCVVGGDSGLTHLSGVLGTPTVVLGGVTDPTRTHTPYPRVTAVSGDWDCAGCFGQSACCKGCQTCGCLQAVSLSRVEHVVGALTCKRAWPYTLLPHDKLAALRRVVWDAPPGVLAELGVARGGSALAMIDADPSRELHLFDTFTGLPDDNPDGPHRRGEFAAEPDACRMLDQYHFQTHYHRGLFPQTAPEGDLPVAVGHFDGDLEASCEAWVRWAWPRVVPGGCLVFDDYGAPEWPGVKRVVDRHFRPEQIESHAPMQATVYKAGVDT